MHPRLASVLRGGAAPLLLLAALEWYARGPGKTSDALAALRRSLAADFGTTVKAGEDA